MKKWVTGLGVVSALALFGILLTTNVHAAARFEGSDASYVRSGETVDGSAYLAGTSVRVEGTINGDLYCAGKDIIITGTVNGDVLCGGMTLIVGGTVTGNIRLAGNSVTVSAQTAGSATIYGSTVTIESAATIGRDATIGGSDVLVNGAVGRDVIGTGSTVTLNGQVARNVEGEYGSLVIGNDAAVGGFLHYASTNDAVVNGKVAGGTERFEPHNYKGNRASMVSDMFAAVFMLLCWVLLVAVALQIVLPKKTKTVTTLTPRQAALVTALGFLSIAGLPVLAGLLIISVVGIPLAVITVLVWCLLLAVSVGVAAIYLGQMLFARRPINAVLATVLASLVLVALMLIPFVNLLVFVVAVSFGVGALLYAVRGEYEGGKVKSKVKLAKG